MRVWVTRTQPGADRTAARLRALGHEPLVTPVLAVRAVAANLDLADVAALAFTSGNAVAAFVAASEERGLPAFAVGASTAGLLREAGFERILTAEGDVSALAAAILAGPPPDGAVLHVAGQPMAGDLTGALATAGVPARTVVVYRTEPSNLHTPEGVETVLIHSPHAGRVVAARLAGAEGWRSVPFACISDAAAAPLRAAGLDDVQVARAPEETALLNLLA